MEKTVPTIHELYPSFNEQEIKETEDNVDRYLNLVLRIFERLESETHQQVEDLTSGTGTLDCIVPQSEASI